MGLRATHSLDPRIATVIITDDAGNHLATYDGKTDTVTAGVGIDIDKVMRAHYDEPHFRIIRQAVAEHKAKQQG